MVVIKDMKMPECCGDCTLNDSFNWKHYCNVTVQEVDFEAETRPANCPLVEIGTCKDCKHWKDSDGVYRRGIGAESKCPINIKEVYEGNFYCKWFEKRGDENGSN